MTVAPLAVRAENARAAIEHVRQCLLLLVAGEWPRARRDAGFRGVPDGNASSRGRPNPKVRGLEVITRALAYTSGGQAFQRAWPAFLPSRVPSMRTSDLLRYLGVSDAPRMMEVAA